MTNSLLPYQQELLDRVRDAVAEVDSGSNSKGILLVGPPGTGKTHAIDGLAALYTRRLEGDQRITPMTRIDTGASPTYKAMIDAGLVQLGGNAGRNATEDTFFDALRVHRTSIVAFEEMQSALTKESRQLRGKNTDFFIHLWNFNPRESAARWAGANPGMLQRKLVLLLSGTDELLPAFASNSALQSRFGTVVYARRLRMGVEDEFRSYRTVVRSMAQRFELSDIIDANDDMQAARLYFATQAHFRLLESLFERVRTRRRRARVTEPADRLLSTAFVETATEAANSLNPFDATAAEIRGLVKAEKRRAQRKPSGAQP